MAVVCWLLSLYTLLLLVHVVMSWVPHPPEPLEPVLRVVRALTEPLLTPLRRIIPPLRTGGVNLDLSVLLLFFALMILRNAIC